MDRDTRHHVIAFLREFRQLCKKHRAFVGLDNTLELLLDGRGSVFFTHFCGNSADAGCRYGQEEIADIDQSVFAA